MESDITFLGRVIRVESNKIEVEVSDSVSTSSPIINGRVYRIGQIGSFVKIVAGNNAAFGIVSSISNVPSDVDNYDIELYRGRRYLTVSLVGEKTASSRFERGVGLYPTINDEVHLVTKDDLRDIYESEKTDGSFPIGRHASSPDLDVYVDLHKMVLRHCAILGSTGSGKSNTVVAIVKQIINLFGNSRVLLVDPHGEYASAFPDARVFRINDTKNPLSIPFWLMNFEELMFFLFGATSTDDVKPEYREMREIITREKKKNCKLKAGDVDPNCVTADSPIPFNIRKLWYDINRTLNATYSDNGQQQVNECLIKEGDCEKLIPAEFQPYSPYNTAPFKSKNQRFYSYEKKLISRLKDSRYDFLFNSNDYKDENSKSDLHDLLKEWIGNEERLAILDLSNVPFEVMDITVGLITRFIFDSMFWGRNEEYTGKKRPLLIAYEEAHAYLGKNGGIYAKEAVEKVFKEGRKFGLGAVVISQRPSEVSETILAQIGTFIALKLTNSSDQSIVKAMSPDNMNALMDLLPSLRIGEAVVVGEAINIPSRIRVDLQSPRPDSSDPNLVEAWSKEYDEDGDYKDVVKKIREQHF